MYDLETLNHDFSKFGLLKNRHARISCAAIRKLRSENDAVFEVVVLADYELTDFLSCIRNNSSRLIDKNIKYLLTLEDHWLAGEILITQDKVRLFFVDSLGPALCMETIDRMVSFFQVCFQDNVFAQYSTLKIQNGGGCCQLFAFNNLRKLCKVANIFSILPVPVHEKERVTLPLSMLRSAQISYLQDLIKQHPDYNPVLPINKKGETIDVAVAKHCKSVVRYGEIKTLNYYLAAKLANLQKKVLDYCAQVDDTQLEEDMNEFGLTAFMQRAESGSVAKHRL